MNFWLHHLAARIGLCCFICAASLGASAQNRFALDYGVQVAPVQYRTTAYGGRYLYFREVGSVYLRGTENLSGSQNFALWATASRGRWGLRAQLETEEEKVRVTYRVGADDLDVVKFFHRAHYLTVGLSGVVPLASRGRVKVGLLPGATYRIVRFPFDPNPFNYVGRLIVSGDEELRYADLNDEYRLPRLQGTAGILFDWGAFSLGAGALHSRPSGGAAASGGRQALYRHSTSFSILLARRIGQKFF